MKYGQVSHFDLYFPVVPPGEYTLHVPTICYRREWSSKPFTLSLPETETLVQCDETTLFPDGSGLHITGVSRTMYEHIQYHQYPGSDELIEDKRYYWQYILEYEKLSGEDAEFQMALITDTEGYVEIIGYPGENQLSFCVLQDHEVKELTLQLVQPEYLVWHNFKIPVTVQDVRTEFQTE